MNILYNYNWGSIIIKKRIMYVRTIVRTMDQETVGGPTYFTHHTLCIFFLTVTVDHARAAKKTPRPCDLFFNINLL